MSEKQRDPLQPEGFIEVPLEEGEIEVDPLDPNMPQNNGEQDTTGAPQYVPELLRDTDYEQDTDFLAGYLSKSDDGFDAAVRLDKGRLRWALTNVKGYSPDVAARVQRIAKERKLPVELIKNNREAWEKWEEARKIYNSLFETEELNEFDQFPQSRADTPRRLKYPYTANFLANPENLAMAKDDVEALKNVESIVKSYNRPWLEQKGHAVKEGVKDLARSFLANTMFLAESISKQDKDLLKNLMPYSEKPEELEKALLAGEKGHEKIMSALGDVRNSEALSPVPLRLEGFDQYTQDFFQMLPQIAGVTASTLLAGPGVGAVFMGQYIFGSSYAELREQGVSHDRATKAAAANAAIQTVMERIQIGAFLNLIKSRGGMHIAKNFFRTILTEWGTEALQAFPEEISRLWAKNENKNFEEKFNIFMAELPDTIKQGAYEGLVVAPFALIGATGAIAGDIKKARELKQDQELWDRQLEAVENSKLQKVSPETMEEFQEGIAKSENVSPNIYLSLDAVTAFAQDDPRKVKEFAKKLDIEDQLEEAERTGRDLEISKAKFASRFAGTEVSAVLRQDIRFDPDGMTEREVSEFKKEFTKELEKKQAEFQTMKEEQALPKELKDIRDKLITSKKEGGFGLKASNADAMLSVWLARANMNARETGESAEAFLKRINPVLQVGGEADKNLQALFQTDPLGFYSQLQKEVEGMDFKQIPAKDLLNRIVDKEGKPKIAGLKKEEIEWTQLADFLNAKEGKVSKEEVVEFLKQGGVQLEEVRKGEEIEGAEDVTLDDIVKIERDENAEIDDWFVSFTNAAEIQVRYLEAETEQEAKELAVETYNADPDNRPVTSTKYGPDSNYNAVLPGGENYREVLLTLPTKEKNAEELEKIFKNYRDELVKKYGSYASKNIQKEEEAKYEELKGNWVQAMNSRIDKTHNYFKSSHWDETNVLAHMRLNDRVDSRGRKTLFVEEIQSDWHQAGRKRGYKNKENKAKADKLNAEANSITKEIEAYKKELHKKYKPTETITLKGNFSKNIRDNGRVEYRRDDYSTSYGFYFEIYKSGNTYTVYNKSSEIAEFKSVKAVENFLNEKLRQDYRFEAWPTVEERNKLNALRDKRRKKQQEADSFIEAVPNAPFKNTDAWSMLAFKRILRMAAEEGYDAVAWTPGEVQAERWKQALITNVKQIHFYKSKKFMREGESYYTSVTDKNGSTHDSIQGRSLTGLDESQVEEIYGKDIAKRIVEEATDKEQSMDTKDLSIGETGMIAFYDKMLPKAVEKYIKKLDKKAKVGVDKFKKFPGIGNEDSDIRDSEKAIEKYESQIKEAENLNLKDFNNKKEHKSLPLRIDGSRDDYILVYDNSEIVTGGKTLQSVIDFAKDDHLILFLKRKIRMREKHIAEAKEAQKAAQEVWHLPLTDKIKEKVLEGQQLFQKDDKSPQGSVIFKENETIINLYKTANMSTFLHETTHIFVNDFINQINAGNATKQMQKDHDTLKEFAGGEFTKEGHEKIARAMEAYLMEGKAPSVKLAEAFSRFRSWLLAIYRSVRGLNVEINDGIREVFDRLLATDNEIAEAREFYEARKDLVDLLDIPTEQKQKLREKKHLSEEEAREKQFKKYMKAYLDAPNRKQEIKSFAEREIDNKPVYKALNTALEEGGFDLEEIKEAYGKDTAKKLKEKHKDAFKKYGKKTVAELAADNNFPSEEALIDALVNAETRKEAVDKRAKEILIERENDIREELSKNEIHPGEESLHNDKNLAYLIAQANILAQKIERQENQRPMRLEAKVFKAAAEDIISRKPAKLASRYDLYAEAEQKYAKQAYKFAEDNKLYDSHEALKKQMGNHALVQAAIKARRERDKIENYYKATKIKKKLAGAENDFAELASFYIEAFSLSTSESIKPQNKQALKKIEELDGVLADMIPNWIKDVEVREGVNTWKDLTMEELRELDDAIKAIIHYGRDELTSLQDEQYKTVAELVEASTEEMSKLKSKQVYEEFSKKGKVLRTLDGLLAPTKMVEFVFERLDNYKLTKVMEFGPLRKLFNRGIKAETDYNKIKQDTFDLAKPHFEVLYAATKRLEKKFGNKGFQVEGLPITESMKREGRFGWTPERLISLILNLGNEGNRQAIENAYGYTPEQTASAISLFTRQELNAMQGLRDTINSLFADLDRVHFKIYNRHLDKVEATEIKGKSADGINVSLPGGYYPLQFDHMLNDVAEKHKEVKEAREQDVMQNRNNAVLRKTKPEDGMTYSRVSGHSLPPKLSMDVWFTHVADTARYISHAEYMRDLNRVTLHKDWRDAVRDKAGRATYKAIRDWVSYQALPERRLANMWERILDKQRRLATMAILGLNIPVGIKQRLSMLSAVKELGVKWVLSGLRHTDIKNSILGLNNSEAWQKMLELSPYLKTRMNNIDRELHDTLDKLSPVINRFKIAGKDFTWKDVQNFMFEWIQMNDRATVGPVWKAAFNKFMAEKSEGMSEKEAMKNAVEYADAIVRTTQPSALPIDLNSLQRSEGMLRLFTSFMTWTMKFGNRLVHQNQAYRDGAISTREYVRHIFYENLMSPWGAAAISSLFVTGELPEWWEYFTAPGENAISWIPIVREVPSSIKYRRPIGQSTAFEGITRATKAGKSFWESTAGNKDWDKTLWDLGRLVEFSAGVPALEFVKDTKRTYENIEKKAR